MLTRWEVFRHTFTRHVGFASSALSPHLMSIISYSFDVKEGALPDAGVARELHRGFLLGTTAVTPQPYDATLYDPRDRIERTLNKLKHCRCIATRYDRKTWHFLAFLHLATFAPSCN